MGPYCIITWISFPSHYVGGQCPDILPNLPSNICALLLSPTVCSTLLSGQLVSSQSIPTIYCDPGKEDTLNISTHTHSSANLPMIYEFSPRSMYVVQKYVITFPFNTGCNYTTMPEMAVPDIKVLKWALEKVTTIYFHIHIQRWS